MSEYKPSQQQRDFDARQLDLFGHTLAPKVVTENVLVDGKMQQRKAVVYPEDYIYDPIGR